MKPIATVFLALFLAVSAEAEFTAQEKDELRKVVNSAVQVSRAQEDAAFAVVSLGAVNKSQLLALLNKLFRAEISAMNCLDMAFSAESNGSLTRPEEIANLKAAAKSLERIRIEAIALVDTMPQNTSLAAARQRLIAADLSTFNQALGYVEFRPANYPRMVGPHGDFDISQATLEHMTQYTLHAQFDALNLWADTTLGTSESLKDFFRKNARALEMMFRTWGMSGGIVLPDDAVKINQDLAAGSGLRPFDFFRVILEIEYIFNTAQVNNFGGRRMDLGATTFVRQFADAFTRVVQELTPAEKVAQFTGRHGAISNTGPGGWAAEFYFDLSDFWTDLDGYGAGVMLFHHIIVGPPAPVSCAECPPPPPACPEFEAKLTLLDNQNARAECVAK